MTDLPVEQGRLLAGRYRLGRVLGSGGAGIVREGEDTLLRRPVAIKQVRLPVVADPTGPDGRREQEISRERVLREARVAARLRHPGLVAVYDVIEADGSPWIVMELVEGRSLAEVLREQGRLSPGTVARLGVSLAYALEAAHRGGVVHRDVKPGNVMVTPDGQPRLTDFGIAVSEGDPALTTTGMVVGSPAYMPPERARGARVGAPGDVWGLGATLFTAVEGETPYAGEGALATLAAIVEDRRRPCRHAGAMGPVLDGLLDPDPRRRPSLAQTRALLRRIADAEPNPAREVDEPPSGPVPASPPEPAAARDSGDEAAVPGTPSAAAGQGAAVVGATRRLGGTPPRVDGPGRSRRATALLVVIGLLLVAGLTGLGLVLTNGDGENRTPPVATGAGDRTGTTTSPTGAPAASPPRGGGTPTSAAGQARADPPLDRLGTVIPDSTDPAPPPRGLRTQNGPTGWSVAVPADWRRTSSTPTRAVFSGGGYPTLLVESRAVAGPSAIDAWHAQEGAVRGSSANYQRLSIRPADGAGGVTAAVWEFTSTSNGQTIRTVDFAVVRNGHGYALLWRVPEAQWAQSEPLLRQIIATFRPGP